MSRQWQQIGILSAWSLAATMALGSAPILNESLKIVPADGLPDDRFGYSADVHDGVVAVGSKWVDENGFNSGAAYLFDASSGEQLAKLLANDGAPNEEFGSAIALDDRYVVVGTQLDNDNGAASGSIYIFEISTGQQLYKILPEDGAAQDEFGRSVAIDNGIVAVSSWKDDDNGSGSGSAYVYDAASGALINKLLAPDGATNDRFGSAISISNGIVAVGAQNDDDHGTNSGSAYLFDAFSGEQIRKLMPDDGAALLRFGNSIGIDGDTVVVGQSRDNVNGSQSGSAYVFDAKSGQQLHKLIPEDGAASDQFSESIGVSAGIVAVGSRYGDDNGVNSGKLYLFDATSGEELNILLASDGVAQDWFGSTVGIDRGVIATGADHDSDNGIWSGGAYVFDTRCAADLSGDGILDFFDVSAFLVAYSNADLLADFSHDGQLNATDVFSFIEAYSTGCP